MAVLSFVEKLAKRTGDFVNNIEHKVIKESSQQAEEDLAKQVSEATSSQSNIYPSYVVKKNKDNQIIERENKSEGEASLEREIEKNSLEKLLGSIESTTTPEELSALMQQYEELLASWSERASLLRSAKHLKEYLSIVAALSMLQKMMQNPDLLLSGKKIAEMLQTNLKSQQQNINEQAQKMQVQNQKLHEQTQALTKQLSQTERSLQASIEALKKDPGKLSPEELQATLKQLQESLKQVQELKERTATGKPLDLNVLQNIQAENQRLNAQLSGSGNLSETQFQAMLNSQQSCVDATNAAKFVQTLQKDISKFQSPPIDKSSRDFTSQIMPGMPETLPLEFSKGAKQIFAGQVLRPSFRLDSASNPQKIGQTESQTNSFFVHNPNGKKTVLSSDTLPSDVRIGMVGENKYTNHNPIETLSQKAPTSLGESNSGQPKAMSGMDQVSKAPVCTGPNCCGGKSHNPSHTEYQKNAQQYIPKPLGLDVVSKAHVCTGPNCCGGKSHIHGHDNPQTLQPKTMGKDTVSKANAHGPGCGCSSCSGGHDSVEHVNKKQKNDTTTKPQHEHGPSCSCCGHVAHATEAVVGRPFEMYRAG